MKYRLWNNQKDKIWKTKVFCCILNTCIKGTGAEKKALPCLFFPFLCICSFFKPELEPLGHPYNYWDQNSMLLCVLFTPPLVSGSKLPRLYSPSTCRSTRFEFLLLSLVSVSCLPKTSFPVFSSQIILHFRWSFNCWHGKVYHEITCCL